MKTTTDDLTIPQASKILAVHPETLRELAKTKMIIGIYKISGQWRISEDAIDVIRRIPHIGEN